MSTKLDTTKNIIFSPLANYEIMKKAKKKKKPCWHENYLGIHFQNKQHTVKLYFNESIELNFNNKYLHYKLISAIFTGVFLLQIFHHCWFGMIGNIKYTYFFSQLKQVFSLNQ